MRDTDIGGAFSDEPGDPVQLVDGATHNRVVAERDAARAEVARLRATADPTRRSTHGHTCARCPARAELEAERDAVQAELDKVHEAILDDWMGRESMPASECVRRILGERDEAREERDEAYAALGVAMPLLTAEQIAEWRRVVGVHRAEHEALTEGQET